MCVESFVELNGFKMDLKSFVQMHVLRHPMTSRRDRAAYMRERTKPVSCAVNIPNHRTGERTSPTVICINNQTGF